MTKNIHQTAIIAEGAKLGKDVQIGPYCIIGSNVSIGDGTILKSHVAIDGNTSIGKNNIIFPFASIGFEPQDLKFNGEETKLVIGDNNKIREYVTIHPGTTTGRISTEVGNDCLIMISVHIAHDCVIGDNVILANNVTLAGHVTVEDSVVIGGLSAAHQFVRIGKHSMIGGMSAVENDVIPYATVTGERAFLAGLNLVGLKRRSFDKAQIHELRKFYKELFDDSSRSLKQRVAELKNNYPEQSLAADIINFIQVEKSRSICKPKKQ